MAPIRVALVGLSQAAKTSWASTAHLPYLLSERGKKKYRIVALLNSSKEAAIKAIQAYALPDGVKAYGSPEDLAKDDDVDLVVCTTRVDVHYGTIEPSIRAGKDIFVEWPLAENVKRATELRDLARQSGSRTMLGLQGRVAPSVIKVKELIQQGAIGKVLSSTLQANTIYGGGNSMGEGLAYFLDKKIGGNPVTIALGHSKSLTIACHRLALISC
jgi:predicted dehydrogenase